MQVRAPATRRSYRRPGRPHADDTRVLAAACAALASFVFAIWALPVPLVLPALSVAAAGAAAALAVAARRRATAHDDPRVTTRDLAGAAALVSIFAALLSDPQQALPLFETSLR